MTIDQVEAKQIHMQDDIKQFTKAVEEHSKNPTKKDKSCTIF